MFGRFVLCVLSVGLFTTAAAQAQTPPFFGSPYTFQNYYGPYGDHIDIDGDGDEDVVMRIVNQPYFGTWINDYPTSFLGGPFLPLPEPALRVVVADVDGDGARDVVAIGATKISVTHIVGSSIGRVDFPHGVAAVQAETVQLADFDGDLDLDVVFTSPTGAGAIACAPNDGTGQFQPTTTFAVPELQGSVVVPGDFDGDGDLDLAGFESIALVNLGSGTTIHVVHQTSPGAFVAVETIPWFTFSTLELFRRAVVADVDGDGNLDLAFATNTANLDLTFVHNIGGGIFRPQATYPLQTTQAAVFGALLAADINHDGRADVLCVGSPLGQLQMKMHWSFGAAAGPSVPIVSLPPTSYAFVNCAFFPIDSVAGDDCLYIGLITHFSTPLGYYVTVASGLSPQGTPPAERISITGGGAAEADFGETFTTPLSARVRDAAGHGLSGRVVTFTRDGQSTPSAQATTDGNGYAALTIAAANDGGFVRWRASTPTAYDSTAEVFERGLTANVGAAQGQTTLTATYHYPRPGVPLIFAADLPSAAGAPTSTAFGDLYVPILSPTPTTVIFDGIGFFSGPDPALVTGIDARWQGSWSAPSAAVAGIPLILQVYGIDLSRGLPDGVIVSNPVYVGL